MPAVRPLSRIALWTAFSLCFPARRAFQNRVDIGHTVAQSETWVGPCVAVQVRIWRQSEAFGAGAGRCLALRLDLLYYAFTSPYG